MTQELTSNRILMDIRFETGNDLTLEEVLFVQNSFHSNWRVKALDQLQFDEDNHSDDSQLVVSIIVIFTTITTCFFQLMEISPLKVV